MQSQPKQVSYVLCVKLNPYFTFSDSQFQVWLSDCARVFVAWNDLNGLNRVYIEVDIPPSNPSVLQVASPITWLCCQQLVHSALTNPEDWTEQWLVFVSNPIPRSHEDQQFPERAKRVKLKLAMCVWSRVAELGLFVLIANLPSHL